MEHKNIKKCPFCGKDAKIHTLFNGNVMLHCIIGCCTEGCIGFVDYSLYERGFNQLYKFKQQAIEAWNTRIHHINITNIKCDSEIKPCPFCGNPGTVMRFYSGFLARCCNSLCRMYVVAEIFIDEVIDRAGAIQAWNKRI